MTRPLACAHSAQKNLSSQSVSRTISQGAPAASRQSKADYAQRPWKTGASNSPNAASLADRARGLEP